MPALTEIGGDLLGGGDGQGVDDAGARQLVEVVGEPGQAVGRVGQGDHAEAEGLAVQRAAQHEGVGARAGAELFG
ncbi:hypothetical protein, partial [Streptomyces hydrogenans]|uniref:hypothetical protein n=1 Tax=Streptomyces hydrogenans TaxID=1873719 RepID=UPI003F53121B